MQRLYVFGTGHALVTKIYNTCYALFDGREFFMLDAGGGNGILTAWEAMDVPVERVRRLFISHAHTDHLLGCVWVTRAVATAMGQGRYHGTFDIYATATLLQKLRSICEFTFNAADRSLLGGRIRLLPVQDGEQATLGGYRATFFNTGASGLEQYGCRFQTPEGLSVVYLGDEPCHACSHPYAAGCDWLISEALCLTAESALHHPRETCHSTVEDVCRTAQTLGAKNLVIAHTEDTHGADRKRLYTAEGAQFFRRGLYVPDDREIIELAP